MVAAALLAGIGYISLSWVDSYIGFLDRLPGTDFAGVLGRVYPNADGGGEQLVHPQARAGDDRRRFGGHGRRHADYAGARHSGSQMGMALGNFYCRLRLLAHLYSVESASEAVAGERRPTTRRRRCFRYADDADQISAPRGCRRRQRHRCAQDFGFLVSGFFDAGAGRDAKHHDGAFHSADGLERHHPGTCRGDA